MVPMPLLTLCSTHQISPSAIIETSKMLWPRRLGVNLKVWGGSATLLHSICNIADSGKHEAANEINASSSCIRLVKLLTRAIRYLKA